MPDDVRHGTGPRHRVALSELEDRDLESTPPPHDLPEHLLEVWRERSAARRTLDERMQVLEVESASLRAAQRRAKGFLIKVAGSLIVAVIGALGAAYSATRTAAERDGRAAAVIEELQRRTTQLEQWFFRGVIPRANP